MTAVPPDRWFAEKWYSPRARLASCIALMTNLDSDAAQAVAAGFACEGATLISPVRRQQGASGKSNCKMGVAARSDDKESLEDTPNCWADTALASAQQIGAINTVVHMSGHDYPSRFPPASNGAPAGTVAEGVAPLIEQLITCKCAPSNVILEIAPFSSWHVDLERELRAIMSLCRRFHDQAVRINAVCTFGVESLEEVAAAFVLLASDSCEELNGVLFDMMSRQTVH